MSTASARDILRDVIYSTITTATPDGSPCAAPMFTVYDPTNRAVYWCAARDSQHGQNIQRSAKAFIVTYDSMAPAGEGSGVYLRCSAAEVVDETQKADAYALLVAKHRAPYWALDDLKSRSPIALFQATVEEAWVNEDKEENGHFVLFRKSIDLSDIG